MEKLNVFGNQEMLVEDLNGLQSNKETAILNRVTDTSQEGIVKVSATEPFIIASDPILVTTLNVGLGVAYNSDGQRIEIMSGESIIADTQVGTSPTYTWLNSVNSTDFAIQTPAQLTPYSTGNINIALVNASGTNYIFIDYIDTLVDTATAWGDYHTKATTAKYTLDQENLNTMTGVTLRKYPYIKGGYRIIVEGAALTIGSDGTYHHPTYSKAIFLGTAVGNGLSAPTITNTYRKYARQLPRTVRIDTPVDSTEITTTYVKSSNYSVDDHIKAVGSVDLITTNNPHGQTIYDLGYNGADISTHRLEQHGPMLYTLNTTSTSTTLYQTCSSADTIRIYYLNTNTSLESVLSGGNRLTNTEIKAKNELEVGGSATYREFEFDTFISVGMYCFYVDSLGLIAYCPESAEATTITIPELFLICKTYWNGLTLQNSSTSTATLLTSRVLDKRVFGSISDRDISIGASGQGICFTPVGAVNQFFKVPTTGWLQLSGQTIDYDPEGTGSPKGTQYYNLVTLLRSIGAPFTSGTTPTQAVLPNMTNMFSRGVGITSAGNYYAVATPSTDAFNIDHTHNYSGTSDRDSNRHYSSPYSVDMSTAAPPTDYQHHHNYSGATTAAVSGTVNHSHTMAKNTILPDYVAMYFCIKY